MALANATVGLSTKAVLISLFRRVHKLQQEVSQQEDKGAEVVFFYEAELWGPLLSSVCLSALTLHLRKMQRCLKSVVGPVSEWPLAAQGAV